MPYERSGLQKVPEQIACILACIAVRYLHSMYRVGLLEQKRKINNITGFFHVLIDISRMENGKKKNILILMCRVIQDMHVKLNVCLPERRISFVLFSITKYGVSLFCTGLHY